MLSEFCCACRKKNIFFTIYRGHLICENCLERFLKDMYGFNFDVWIKNEFLDSKNE